MLRNKFFILASATVLFASFNAACSKKGPTTAGEVKTEVTSAMNRIHFDFDKYNIREDAVPVMQNNASWLKANPNVNIIVEGHCDEWGTNEYNMALGERRANSGKNYLVNLGISDSRISTVSFGEERPLDPGHNKAAWDANRRDEFVLRK
jgi:peptidoglycan-associated lipoprotein